MPDDTKDSAPSGKDADESSAPDSKKSEEPKSSGDEISVGNVSGSTGVAIGRDAQASVTSTGAEEKQDEKPVPTEKEKEDAQEEAEPVDSNEKPDSAEEKAADTADNITTGNVTGSGSVAVGRGATATVNNIYQTITAPLRKGPKWLLGLLEWFDTSAILQVLSFLIITGIPTAAAYVALIGPALAPCEQLPGDWNVAVMQFTPVGEQPLSQDNADQITNRFANRIADEFEEIDAAQSDVTFAVDSPDRRKCRTIKGDTPEERAASAEAIAADLNAQVVVYGTVVLESGSYQVQPEFYIAIDNRYETDEMVGQHAFGRPIALSGTRDNISSEISLNTLLGDRAQALAWITRGLSLYFQHNYDDALAFFEQANQNELWTSSDGREVLYLFQGNAAVRGERIERAKEAYLLALEREPEYARGYAGLASAFYLEALQAGGDGFDPDLDILERAERNFETALTAEVSPPTADVDVKARFGLGQIYLVRWLLSGDQADKDLAIEEFEWVIGQYATDDEVLNTRIREFAAESHARLGLIAVRESSIQDEDGAGELLQEAITRYTTAIELSSIPGRRALYWRTLGNVYTSEGRTEDAEQARNNAITQFEAAIPLTSQPLQRAELYASIAEMYETLGQWTEARNAWREAVVLAEEAIAAAEEEDLRGFPEAERAHVRLAELAIDQGSFELAISDYESAIEFALNEADRARYYVALADVYTEIGDEEQAASALEQAIVDYESLIEAADNEVVRAGYYESLADVYFDLEDDARAGAALELAIADYETAIESTDNEVSRARHYVAIADIYLALDDEDQALTVLEQALDDLEDEGAQGIIREKLAEVQE